MGDIISKFEMIKCHFWQDIMNIYFNVRMKQFHTQEDADQLIEEIKRIRPKLLSKKEFKKRIAEKKKKENNEIVEWSIKSKKGIVCGIFGCFEIPKSKCPICSNHYCYDHVKVHLHKAP